MRDLSCDEINDVTGAGFWHDVMYALGYITGAGAATQKAIDEIGNEMLGAMQYGA